MSLKYTKHTDGTLEYQIIDEVLNYSTGLQSIGGGTYKHSALHLDFPVPFIDTDYIGSFITVDVPPSNSANNAMTTICGMTNLTTGSCELTAQRQGTSTTATSVVIRGIIKGRWKEKGVNYE